MFTFWNAVRDSPLPERARIPSMNLGNWEAVLSTLVRTGFRASLAGFLAATLVAAPVLAASRPLGMVIQAENARVGNTAANNGVTVFAGDTLTTDPAGLLRVRAGGVQIYLRENSRATVDEFSGSISAGLQKGTVGFSSTGETPVAVHASTVWVHPQTTEPTHGEVTMVSPTEFVITSYRGAVEVTAEGETHVVPQGSAYKITLEDDRKDPAGAGSEHFNHHKLRGYLLAGGIVAGGVALILMKNLPSPITP